jgi:xylan 1,4-beta-xylosidase
MDVVRRRPDGTLAFQWHQVDKVYDALLSMGLQPFVELNPMPRAMASGTQTIFEWHMNVTPPKVWEEWGQLVREFTRHVIGRYGPEEVKNWYFEVWNEPNLPGFWSGNQEDYWRLYTVAAREIKQLEPALRVGGPASSKGAWVQDLIQYCEREAVPLDFISTHHYPQDVHIDAGGRGSSRDEGGDFFIRRIQEIRAEITASPRPDLELHFTEWNTLYAETPETVTWTRNSATDACFGAPLIVRICLALDECVDTLCYWTASDIFEESGLPHSAFDGNYGLLNIHGQPKAHFHAFAFLQRMRGDRLDITGGKPVPGWGAAVATRDTCATRVLLAFDRAEEAGAVWADTLILEWNSSKPPIVVCSRIAPGCGSAYETFVALGRPQNLSPATSRLLAAHSQPEVLLEVAELRDGMAHLPFVLHAGEVLLFEIEEAEPERQPKGRSKQEIEMWNRLMNDPSKA